MLPKELEQQLNQYLELMENPVQIQASTDDSETSERMMSLLDKLSSITDLIQVETTSLKRSPSFNLKGEYDESSRVTFAGVPLGHEFTSLVLAILQISGRPPKVDDDVVERIKALDGTYNFETFISLSCTKCPDVVQALNLMSILNPNVTHTMIDGASFQDEAEDIMAVPTIFLNGTEFGSGRMSVEDILVQLGEGISADEIKNKDPFDTLVIGGGPAGAASAIYAARKGIRTGIVSQTIGGQVEDTNAIENFIGTTETDGTTLAKNLATHINDYDIDVIKQCSVTDVQTTDDGVAVILDNDGTLYTRSLVIATGARWRQLGVPGEEEYKNKGVAYCPHCDGPLFKGKDVAVVGGGNSGIEAAIDLANVVKHVTVVEFAESLQADQVLIDRLNSLSNTTVITNAATTELTGGEKLQHLTYIDRKTDEEQTIDIAGAFIQIGLLPNTEFLPDIIEFNKQNEIVIDKRGATNVPGIFAAGDCTNQAYKQIIISMGSGATAALSAFDHLMRS